MSFVSPSWTCSSIYQTISIGQLPNAEVSLYRFESSVSDVILFSLQHRMLAVLGPTSTRTLARVFIIPRLGRRVVIVGDSLARFHSRLYKVLYTLVLLRAWRYHSIEGSKTRCLVATHRLLRLLKHSEDEAYHTRGHSIFPHHGSPDARWSARAEATPESGCPRLGISRLPLLGPTSHHSCSERM
jgi:hypothetical protein